MPFLSVITRTYKRPGLLEHNRASLARQTDPDYEHVILRDDDGIGIAQTHVRLRDVLPKGRYVLVLDDDDMIIRETLIAELKALAIDLPGVIMTRMDHGPRGILPPDEWWGKLPPVGCVGISAPIVRADVYADCAHAWGAHYAGDHDFVAALFAHGAPIVWHDVIATKVQGIGLGRPEADYA